MNLHIKLIFEMKKIIAIILVISIFCSISFAQSNNHYTSVKVDSKKGFDNVTDSVLKEAIRLLELTINSDEFKSQILSSKFSRNKGYSNSQISDLFKQGDEYGNNIDYIVNLNLEIYSDYAGGGEVGVTTLKDHVTHTYNKYIIDNGAACYAAHLAHEYCHVLGFTHPKYHFLGKEKKQSVPYVIGNIVSSILKVSCP